MVALGPASASTTALSVSRMQRIPHQGTCRYATTTSARGASPVRKHHLHQEYHPRNRGRHMGVLAAEVPADIGHIMPDLTF